MSPITVIQILNKFETDKKIFEIIHNNSNIFSDAGIEYFILDTSNTNHFISKIKNLENYRKNKFQYLKKENINMKETFLSAFKIASFDRIYFLENDIEVTLPNLQKIENESPILTKENIEFFKETFPNDFKFSEFKYYIKKDKTFLDKLKFNFKKF